MFKTSITTLLRTKSSPFKILISSNRSTSSTSTLDPEQLKQMSEHQLLLVNKNDEIIGSASKWDAHHISSAKLHRAFSLFIFNQDKTKLLLQKRSKEKITFPSLLGWGCWKLIIVCLLDSSLVFFP